MSLIDKTREFLRSRKLAYQRCFNPEDQADQTVLADLARFCRAHGSTAHADPAMAARLDGRREVWLRIQQHLRLDEETLWSLYGGPNRKV